MTARKVSFGARSRDEQLDCLLSPRSVAVVGASNRPGWGLKTIENLEAVGYEGTIFPVNPRHGSIGERPCYPALRDLPEVPDAAVFAIPAAGIPAGVAEAVDLGIGAAVVYASGFGAAGEGEGGEVGEESPRTLLQELCNGEIALLGPNCLGSINYAGRAPLYGISMPYVHAGTERGMALVAQSGNMALTLAGANRGVSLTHLISCGNQLDLTVSELLGACLRDPAVAVLSALIEGVPDTDRLARVLEEAADRDRPVLVLKVGRSELGQAATVAHTGSLSGSDALYRSFFRQHGAIQVDDLDELLSAAAVMAHPRRPRKPGVAVFASSGGECGLVSDIAESVGLELPSFSEEVASDVAGKLPSFGRVSNPLDITAGGWGDAALYADLVTSLAKSPGIGAIVSIADSPSLEETGVPEAFWGIVDGLSEGSHRTGATGPLVALVNSIGDVDRQVPLRAGQSGVVPLAGLRAALSGLARAGRYDAWRTARSEASAPFEVSEEAREKVARLLASAPPGPMSEDLSKEVISAYGVPVPERRYVTSVEAAVQAAGEIGHPSVVKVAVKGAVHKSDIGGVALGLRSDEDVKVAATRLLDVACSFDIGQAGLLVERQVEGGTELIIGGERDALFGPVVLVGLGGVLTELLGQVTHRFGRLSPAEAAAMLDEMGGRDLLESYRGAREFDREGLANAIAAVTALFEDHPRLTELDLNPVVTAEASGQAIALDALVVLS